MMIKSLRLGFMKLGVEGTIVEDEEAMVKEIEKALCLLLPQSGSPFRSYPRRNRYWFGFRWCLGL
jgi:hypothetical protein